MKAIAYMRRSQKALEMLQAGQANTLVVAKLSRITRRPKDWAWLTETMQKEGWTILAADFDVDLNTPGGRMIAGIVMQVLAFEYEEKRDGYKAARSNAVLRHGVHGGDKAPLGYDWTVRGYDRKGSAQRGPLEPNADAARVKAAFEARAAGGSWREILGVLGVPSQGNASAILSSRVYLGEAKSGDYVKEGAHPALVDEDLFRRANHRKVARNVGYGHREGSLLSLVLRCGTCGRALVYEANARGDYYRCKNLATSPRARRFGYRTTRSSHLAGATSSPPRRTTS